MTKAGKQSDCRCGWQIGARYETLTLSLGKLPKSVRRCGTGLSGQYQQPKFLAEAEAPWRKKPGDSFVPVERCAEWALAMVQIRCQTGRIGPRAKFTAQGPERCHQRYPQGPHADSASAKTGYEGALRKYSLDLTKRARERQNSTRSLAGTRNSPCHASFEPT